MIILWKSLISILNFISDSVISLNAFFYGNVSCELLDQILKIYYFLSSREFGKYLEQK